jgi:hypothetical protein
MKSTWRLSIASHTARFAASSNEDQFAISTIVRRQPSHSPVDGFIRHTLMHGEGTGAMDCAGS